MQPRSKSHCLAFVMSGLVVGSLVTFVPAVASAQEPAVVPRAEEPAAAPRAEEPTMLPRVGEPTMVPSAGEPTVAPRADEPEPAPRFKESEHFTIDPVADGVLIGGGATFSMLLGLVLGTGEIKPTVPGKTSVLLSIDQYAVTQTVDPNAGRNSTIGLYAAYAFAVVDPILTGFRDGKGSFLVDAVMYAESISLTGAFTEMTKIAVRRPRPIDYALCNSNDTTTCTSNTDLQLSFFSGHASGTGAITGTATYLAFVRSPHTARPWITLGVGTALTAFVSYERVRSGEHFPTDVIMGSLAGAAIGVLVPHIHRHSHYHNKEFEAVPTWIGFAPTSNGHGAINAGWIF